MVDVTSFNDQTWFDLAGNFHSEAPMVERYTRQPGCPRLPRSRIRKSSRGRGRSDCPLSEVDSNVQLLSSRVEFVEEMIRQSAQEDREREAVQRRTPSMAVAQGLHQSRRCYCAIFTLDALGQHRNLHDGAAGGHI